MLVKFISDNENEELKLTLFNVKLLERDISLSPTTVDPTLPVPDNTQSSNWTFTVPVIDPTVPNALSILLSNCSFNVPVMGWPIIPTAFKILSSRGTAKVPKIDCPIVQKQLIHYHLIVRLMFL